MEFVFEKGLFPDNWCYVRNIFIIGKTKSAKSALADWIETKYPEFCRVQASEWIKAECPWESYQLLEDSYPEYVKFLSHLSAKRLKENPDACIDYIKRKYRIENGMYAIEGIRNPRDFMSLFDPERDMVLFLSNPGHEFDGNFDDGIEVIKGYVEWLAKHMLFANFEGVLVK
jgi:hypothetical protein